MGMIALLEITPPACFLPILANPTCRSVTIKRPPYSTASKQPNHTTTSVRLSSAGPAAEMESSGSSGSTFPAHNDKSLPLATRAEDDKAGYTSQTSSLTASSSSSNKVQKARFKCEYCPRRFTTVQGWSGHQTVHRHLWAPPGPVNKKARIDRPPHPRCRQRPSGHRRRTSPPWAELTSMRTCLPPTTTPRPPSCLLHCSGNGRLVSALLQLNRHLLCRRVCSAAAAELEMVVTVDTSKACVKGIKKRLTTGLI